MRQTPKSSSVVYYMLFSVIFSTTFILSPIFTYGKSKIERLSNLHKIIQLLSGGTWKSNPVSTEFDVYPRMVEWLKTFFFQKVFH